MVIHRPDFIVIGAMKSATTTLHEQLARQPGVFMSRPKEPNFFSDDEIYARGWGWYSSHFRAALPGAIRGESSTHYTKLPTFPWTVERMFRDLPRIKLIYVMRHPIDRLLSQYVHELTAGRIRVSLLEAVHRHPELIDYSSQLGSWLGIRLDCANFDAVTRAGPHFWAGGDVSPRTVNPQEQADSDERERRSRARGE